MISDYQARTSTTLSPKKIIFGCGSAASAAAEAHLLGGSKALLVTDPGVVAAGLLGTITASLDDAGLPYIIYDKVEAEPPARIIDDGGAMFAAENCDLIIGIGGGSALDVAKGISVLSANPGKILDYSGVDRVPRKGVPMILIPTTAGTGSEVTRVLVMTDEQQNTKNVVFSPYVMPEAALIDPDLTLSLPPTVTADSGMDALVHAIEAFVSVNATPFSDLWAMEAIRLIGRYLPVACAKGGNKTARYNMSMAATLAGLAFTNAGLGAVHALAYPLGTEYHMSHGRTNAIMLPHVMQFNLPGNYEKYRMIAGLLGKRAEGIALQRGAALAVEAVLDLETAIGVSWQPADYGIPEQDLALLVGGAMKQARLFVPNPRDLGEDDVRGIYRHAFAPHWPCLRSSQEGG